MADIETTETENEAGSDKELNFRKMEEAHKETVAKLEGEIAELRPYRDRDLVREAGFDPGTDKGTVLERDLGLGDIAVEEGQELAEAIKSFAKSKYGWDPAPARSPVEAEHARIARERAGLKSDTESADKPETLRDQIIEARANNDFALASELQVKLERQQNERRRTA